MKSLNNFHSQLQSKGSRSRFRTREGCMVEQFSTLQGNDVHEHIVLQCEVLELALETREHEQVFDWRAHG